MPDQSYIGSVAVILSAGYSSRMGVHKAFLPWNGTSLLEYQIYELHAAGIEKIVVVVGNRAEEVSRLATGKSNVQIVNNRDYNAGKVSSILTGLRSLKEPPDLLLIIGVDQPRPRNIYRTLLDSHRSAKNTMISTPTYRGRRGHPPIFSPVLFNELLEITEKDQGLRSIMEKHAQQTQEIPVDHELAVVDLNTPEDYERALRLVQCE